MMLYGMLLGTALYLNSASASCKNDQYKQTNAARNASGVVVALQMHTDDDHKKELHWCESEYQLRIVRADGSSAQTGWDNGNEAEWNRLINFRIEGFSDGGKRAVTLLYEGGKNPMVEVLMFGLATRTPGVDASYTLTNGFLQNLGVGCVASLQVSGLTKEGQVVIATKQEGGCRKQTAWKISGQRNARGANLAARLPIGVPVIPLQAGMDVDQSGR